MLVLLCVCVFAKIFRVCVNVCVWYEFGGCRTRLNFSYISQIKIFACFNFEYSFSEYRKDIL